MYDDDNALKKTDIPLTTNASYRTTSSQALELESKMYDDDGLTAYRPTPSQPDRKMYDYVDNEALKKSDVPLTAM